MIRSTIDSKKVFPLFNVNGFKEIQTDNVSDLMEKAGANFTVLKKQSKTEDGRLLNSFYLEREDTNEVLCDSVGPDWTVVQNKHKFEWFQHYLDSKNFTLVGAGALWGGREISILAKVNLPDVEVAKGDMVGFYVHLSDYFGSRALRAQALAIRLICANGSVRTEISGGLKLRHTTKVNVRLNDAQETFKYLTDEFKETANAYSRMVNRQIGSDQELRDYIESVLELRNEKGELSSQATNKRDRLINVVDGFENIVQTVISNANGAVAPRQRNYWQAYNAITDYLNHQHGRSIDNRVQSLLNGPSLKIERKAFELAVGE